MRERIYFECDEVSKKEILEALKNEQKYNKKIDIYDKDDEVMTKTIKWDTYSNYIDFWLDNYICDSMTQLPGKIKSIETYIFETSKGQKIKRIKKIIA